MILAIDCGNSRLKWGVHDGVRWVAQGLLDYAGLCGFADLLRAQPRAERAVACNVAGAQAGEAVEAAVAAAGLPLHWAKSQSAQHGVRNLYERPEQLGADRWAGLIGARALHPGACLVVGAGTATTVDVLDAEGGFQGGLILPGVELMRRALAVHTAQLPLADGRFAGLPRNTMDAIVSGCLQAQAGAVERMYEQVAALPGAVCLVGGGAAGQFFELLRVPKRRVDNLVLEGLARIGGGLTP
ncbi:MAG: type III pantothenate kinase [Rhodocyclaceae bacterium]|jgi:type III pantothenate kinase|nr:Type III pantothenate kinase [Rhodocyclaceae bacterium]MCC6879030.1 type III pantothenate kinase [Rhodocyclaceae bacterium]MCL4680630.1 type III pantothenate kinase [Rhodocyclaceae bacterium]